MIRTPLVVLLVALAALVAAPAAFGGPLPRVELLSRSLSGGFPNGPSHDGAISQDRQYARYAAFDSDASDIVRGRSISTLRRGTRARSR